MKQPLPTLFLIALAFLLGFWLGRSGFNPPPDPGVAVGTAVVPTATHPPLTRRPAATVAPSEARPTATTIAAAALPVVERIVDGDTVQLDTGETVRLIGINTPERNQPFYEEARAFTSQLLLDQPVRVETDVEPQDRYGRTLAYLFLQDGTFANLEIVRQGYAQAWNIPPNSRYAAEFAAAEAEARGANVGIWTASEASIEIVGIEADPPGPDSENLNAETVTLRNKGRRAVQLEGFRLSDRSNNTYIFPNFSLAGGATVVLHSGRGRDDDRNLYWGSSSPIWNNDGDTAFLRDPAGNTVDVFSYGVEAP